MTLLTCYFGSCKAQLILCIYLMLSSISEINLNIDIVSVDIKLNKFIVLDINLHIHGDVSNISGN